MEIHFESILDQICSAASRYPNALAVEHYSKDGEHVDATVLKYKTLLQMAKALASSLPTTGKYVGLDASERSPEFIIGLLALMIARKAFVPIDVKGWPNARVDTLCKKLGIDLILTKDKISQLAKCEAIPPFQFSAPKVKEDDLAYCICTSGSTGEPKCIQVSHGGIPNLANNQRKLFEAGPTSRFLWILSPVFDGSLSDIFVALSSGSTVVIDDHYDPCFLWELADERSISTIDVPPSLLKASMAWSSKIPNSVKTLVVGGEQLPREVVDHYAPHCRIVNVYGPTEATICTSAKVYTSENASDDITIGEPFSGVDYKLYDSNSTISELMIGGRQLALGYVGEEKLTAEKFPRDIYGKRWFKTGDLVEKLPNGEWKFLGRNDRQFKVSGKLVAPEEIEAAAAKHGAVAAVVLDGGKIKCLIETFKPACAYKMFAEDLFRSELPEWMVPSKIEFTSHIPRLQSGKINFQEVQKMLSSPCNSGVEPASKMTKDECVVAGMINEIAGNHLTTISVNSDLKGDFGLDSIQFISLALKIRSKYGIQLCSSDFIENNTIKKIASFIERRLHGGDVKQASTLASEASSIESTIMKYPKKKSAILITGGAGFLGSHVIKEVLHSLKNNEPVFCIARAEDLWTATTKIVDAVYKTSTGMTREEIELRLDCLAGDLSKEHFGLDLSEYTSLCNDVRLVYHIAGEVNDWKAASELAASNVKATANVVKFCKVDGDAELVFASTLSVFVARDDLPRGYVCQEEKLHNDGVIVGGYAQSKWIAEKIVTDMMPTAKILRYGLLTEPVGKSMIFKRSTLSMFFRGAKYLSCLPRLPDTRMAVDLTPVDFAAKLTVASTTSSRQIFHIHAGMQVNYNALAKRLGYLDIDFAGWKKMALSHVDESEDVLACYEAISREDGCKFGPFDLFQSTDIVFDRAATVELMDKAGITAPSEEQYLNQLMRIDHNEADKTW